MPETSDHSFDCTNVSDQIFYQMLFTAFGDTDKLGYFLNEKEKIEFVRHYTGLISRLSYVKLQQQQWDFYYRIGMTHHIRMGRIPKHLEEKNSIHHTYGRSKTLIEQRLKKIQQEIQQAQNVIKLFERQLLLKTEQHIDCSSEMRILNSIINTFGYENQQRLTFTE